MSEVENDDYKEKDIVWTKVKGNQWWPSLITQVSIKQITTLGKTTKEKIYTIELIGEKSSAKVTSEKIESFIKEKIQETTMNDNNHKTLIISAIFGNGRVRLVRHDKDYQPRQSFPLVA
jgi:hypothetical protein